MVAGVDVVGLVGDTVVVVEVLVVEKKVVADVVVVVGFTPADFDVLAHPALAIRVISTTSRANPRSLTGQAWQNPP